LTEHIVDINKNIIRFSDISGLSMKEINALRFIEFLTLEKAHAKKNNEDRERNKR
jgi:hypothetical protein